MRAKLHFMSYKRATVRSAPQVRHSAPLAISAVLLLLPTLNVAAPAASANAQVAPAPVGCLASGNGFLRARIRGALNLDVNWQNAELECDGAARPNGNGIRLSFAGPLRSDGRRMRIVFGVTRAAEGSPGSALPTNLTVIFEGEKRLFATRGDDKCTVDKLQQERVESVGGDTRSYRVVGSGFCTEPANTLNEKERIVVSSFDFAGRVTYSPAPAAAPTATPLDPPPP
jgi:hypothetical protein